MRRAGNIVAETIYALFKSAEVGITTGELARIADGTIRKQGGESAFFNYRPPKMKTAYPGIVCISVNEEVVHGIPGKRKLIEGDVVSFDVGVFYDGYVGDGSGTVIIGEGSPTAKRLVEVTKRCLYRGIEQAVIGNKVSDIGRAVQECAETAGFGVVRDLVGHGVGRKVHESPPVPNFRTAGISPKLRPGMTLAIEPMITAGDWHVAELDDGWTIITADKSLAAHFEHTIAITNGKPEILTLRENGKAGFETD
jgi:methionyl aminopeptidase